MLPLLSKILHSTGLEFQREMAEATDLDLVIAMHARYMCRVHERCLLHKKVQFIRDIVTQVLNMALTFADHWNDGVVSYRWKGAGVICVRYRLSATNIKYIVHGSKNLNGNKD